MLSDAFAAISMIGSAMRLFSTFGYVAAALVLPYTVKSLDVRAFATVTA